MVRVETNIAQPPAGDLNSVRVRVYSGAGPARTLRHDGVRVVGDNGVRLPFRFAVLPRDEEEGGVVTVEVAGCSDSVCGDPREGYAPVLVEQRAIVSFIPGQVWEVPVFLAVSCRGVRCVDPQLEQTCRPETGTCGPARVTPGAADAGPAVDGAADAVVADRETSVDAAADAAGDVAEDARADVAPDAPADARADVAPDAGPDAVMDARDALAADAGLDADAAPPMDVRVDAADAGLDADAPAPMDARDAAADAGLDVDAPAPMDAPADLGPDADAPAPMDARDVEADAPPPPDAPADLPTEPVRSCGTGASAQTCRASEDCCVLGSCGCLLVAVCTPRGVIGCR